LTAPCPPPGGKARRQEAGHCCTRGGDFPNTEKGGRILPLGLKDSDKAALVEFLRNGLTDCRTANDEAPFDHPSLTIPNGGPDLPATGGGTSCRQAESGGSKKSPQGRRSCDRGPCPDPAPPPHVPPRPLPPPP